jgi:hypothetical protein
MHLCTYSYPYDVFNPPPLCLYAYMPICLYQVGICSVWFEGNPCNMHLLDLSASVKEGVQGAGLTGFRFNTIGVSDGISMGTDGMCYSLQSRDVIADSIETTMGGQWYDGLVAIPGCDKNMPGCLIAMGRLNRPALMVYGGTIRAGCTEKFPQLDIVSAFQVSRYRIHTYIHTYIHTHTHTHTYTHIHTHTHTYITPRTPHLTSHTSPPPPLCTVLRREDVREDQRGGEARDRRERMSRPRGVWWYVHCQHHGYW